MIHTSRMSNIRGRGAADHNDWQLRRSAFSDAMQCRSACGIVFKRSGASQ